MRLLALLFLVAALGCAKRVFPVDTSGEKRIWVIQRGDGDDRIYRCADGAGENEPPKPLCVRAPIVDLTVEK